MKKQIFALILFFLHVSLLAKTCCSQCKNFQYVPRACASLNIRTKAACFQTLKQRQYNVKCHHNTDEKTVPDFAAQFTKLFEHDLGTSVLTEEGQEQYSLFFSGLSGGSQKILNAVQPASQNLRVWVNPQAANAYSLQGIDSQMAPMPNAPSFTSDEAAAEMIEVYLQAICRNVLFSEYGTGAGSDNNGMGGSITSTAACILTSLGDAFKGPKINGQVTPETLFRGSIVGNLTGPYVSQFLLQPLYPLFPSGCAPFVAGLIGVQNLDLDILARPQYVPIPENREFGVSWTDFVAIQNGAIPLEYDVTDYNQTTTRYPITGRDMGGLVHTDSPYQAYYNALDILTYTNAPIDPIFPYANGSILHEGAGITMGQPDAYGLVGGVAIAALKAAWAQKWLAHRRLRPEAFAGLVHQAKVTNTNPYNISNLMFQDYCGTNVLTWTKNRNAEQALIDPGHYPGTTAETYLLAQMYPEGSPAHPSYPAGHGTIAGACVTVIKAIMDDQAKINTLFVPVKVDPFDPRALVPLSGEGENEMTIGSELNKLASNIALARDFGGVHFRSDSEQGILLGEEIAIHYLQDQARTYAETGFKGFELTKFDGTRIRITATTVKVI